MTHHSISGMSEKKCPSSGRVYYEMYRYLDKYKYEYLRRETELDLKLRKEERKGTSESENKVKAILAELETVRREITAIDAVLEVYYDVFETLTYA